MQKKHPRLCQTKSAHELNLYTSTKQRFPLIAAVLENRQQGWVLTNSSHAPTHCFVINKFGFCQEFYGTYDPKFFELVTKLIISGKHPKLRMYAPTSPMEAFLRTVTFATRCERTQFSFHNEISNQEYYGSRFDFHDYTNRELHQTNFGLDLANRYWNGEEDFLKNALPLGAFDNDIPTGICYAAAIGLNRAEVDIFVIDAYRKRGLGAILARCFIAKCRERGFIPNWDCYSNNHASMKLAGKIGFKPSLEYAFYNISRL